MIHILEENQKLNRWRQTRMNKLICHQRTIVLLTKPICLTQNQRLRFIHKYDILISLPFLFSGKGQGLETKDS